MVDRLPCVFVVEGFAAGGGVRGALVAEAVLALLPDAAFGGAGLPPNQRWIMSIRLMSASLPLGIVMVGTASDLYRFSSFFFLLSSGALARPRAPVMVAARGFGRG
ncbi:hypothetical protein [Billgrantia antri]|uniref:hypothetical protein n=1 Tax=Billgrantia antri TaxID=2846777 RepID=UPI003B20EDE4